MLMSLSLADGVCWYDIFILCRPELLRLRAAAKITGAPSCRAARFSVADALKSSLLSPFYFDCRLMATVTPYASSDEALSLMYDVYF